MSERIRRTVTIGAILLGAIAVPTSAAISAQGSSTSIDSIILHRLHGLDTLRSLTYALGDLGRGDFPRLGLAVNDLGKLGLAVNDLGKLELAVIALGELGLAVDSLGAILAPGILQFAESQQRAVMGISVGRASDGARVTGVQDDGPAERAGLMVDDVITHIGGRSLLETLGEDEPGGGQSAGALPMNRLLRLAQDWEKGDQVTVHYLRGGEPGTVTVTVEPFRSVWSTAFLTPASTAYSYVHDRLLSGKELEQLRTAIDSLSQLLPERERTLRTERERTLRRWETQHVRDLRELRDLAESASAPRRIHGAELTDMRDGLSSYFGTDKGVLVLDVDEDSFLGIKSGDVILRVGEREATNASRVVRILRSYGDDEEIQMTVMRNGKEMLVTGSIGD